MKIFIFAFFIFFISFAKQAEANIEQERKKCDQIKCDDLKGEDEYRCRQQSKSCYLRVFETQLIDWKAKGIPRRVKSDVLKSLEGARDQNNQVAERLKKELILIDQEINQISERIDAIKALQLR